MKRVAIYFFYDADGVVDRYVEYIIKELRTVSDYLLVVVNGKLTPKGREIFADLADDFFVRKNDFDAPAYKDAIEYITWDKLLEYDELILSSATFYGPTRPFKDVFAEMDEIKCDYWGINRVYRDDTVKNFLGKQLPWRYKPEYVSSNFHVYRSRLLHSYEFKKHWTTLPEISCYADSAIYHEMAIAVKMENAGFTFETLDRDMPRGVYPSTTVSGAYAMIKDYNIPFVRRKTIYDPNGSSFDYGQKVSRQILDYVSEHTNYDAGMIWENQLRTNSLYDLKNWVGLHRIVPADTALNSTKPTISYAVLFYLKDVENLDICTDRLKELPSDTHILLMCNNEETIDTVKADPIFERFELDTAVVSGPAGEVSALLEGGTRLKEAGKYEAVCFITDPTATTAQYAAVPQIYSTQCYENALKTSVYAENILRIMEKEPNAGLLVPPPPTHEKYYSYTGGTWENNENYKHTEAALKKLERHVIFSNDKPPMPPYGPIFWFRISALDPLFDSSNACVKSLITDVTNEHFEFFKYLYPLLAQSNGYYTLNISERDNTEFELLHMTYETQKLRQVGTNLIGGKPTNSFNHLRAMMNQQISAYRKAPPAPATPASAANEAPVPQQGGSKFKRFVKSCMPRGLWNLLRKARCKAKGWVYVED